MATLALGALGTLFGGPVGGAIGALAGRQIDASIIGGSTREGPRLEDLTITTSSYGSPIAKHYGRMRVAGTIIWATDLQENRETTGGGKGKPKTTRFSYSTSLAVALSSRAIHSVGRIWADGNLLRGASGDLKTGGQIRVYAGHGDQPVDPLIAADKGSSAPAFRGCAYVVFEDLQLEDFGNRIPALSFEVFADNDALTLEGLIGPYVAEATGDVDLASLAGFSYSGGSLRDAISTIGQVYPISVSAKDEHISFLPKRLDPAQAVALGEAVPAWTDGDFGDADGASRERSTGARVPPQTLRYYDTDRDYQPGTQRAHGRAPVGAISAIEFPGALTPANAKSLINNAALRSGDLRESLRWRIAELDPALAPGAIVSVPDIAGYWTIEGWEWRDRGVELDLARARAESIPSASGDAGFPALPDDLLPEPTHLRVFELPWDGAGASGDVHIYAALAGETEKWSGAALFAGANGPLVPLGPSGRAQTALGALVTPLAPSQSVLFEPVAALEVELIAPSMTFASSDLSGIAKGQNRLLIGEEIVQFATAEQVSPAGWRLHGLLRGRGGSEHSAAISHPAGSPVTLLGSQLVPLDTSLVSQSSSDAIAAIGRGDEEPVVAAIGNSGMALRPLSPVHPKITSLANGDLLASWTRRARGAWNWPDHVETPLNEESERYQIGIGSTLAPDLSWELGSTDITIPQSQLAAHLGKDLWVKQIGRASRSHALLLGTIP
ncbi:phage tail protein [Pontixanthobacter aquaemixtae]|uniref:Tip attachment protein J domain-containing protein n=1 Tax=Pontixanthobacter aquaemixtae TaxID=1958940 RepID=A0A844ZSC1_9SPHN|nr:phage tail protein [Pontixanthobacter aquaemixtae]MXO91231.1 hypothetical protein [Pontixanthobacter aquaemixtae]